MLFDAGRTGFTQFVANEDDKSSESILDEEYFITENSDDQEPQDLLKVAVPIKRYTLKTICKNNEVYKTQFENRLKKYLLNNSKRILTAIFISHPDGDHYNLVSPFNLNPGLFVLGGEYSLYSEEFHRYVKNKDCITDLQYNEPDSASCFMSDEKFKNISTFNEDEEVKIKILTVNAKKTGENKDKNADSMIVKVSQKHSMIIPGDAERETWEDAQKTGNLNTDVLLLSHHGSNTRNSTTLELLNKIGPKAWTLLVWDQDLCRKET